VAQAKYQEIADRLRDQIDNGTLQPGDRLPSEPDLVKMFDASRNTVRLAIALLTNQGLVVTRQGLGTFVNEAAVPFTALLSRIRAQPAGQSRGGDDAAGRREVAGIGGRRGET
jgi:GntR family transcriptional regulator